jgi:hypothetical protein
MAVKNATATAMMGTRIVRSLLMIRSACASIRFSTFSKRRFVLSAALSKRRFVLSAAWLKRRLVISAAWFGAFGGLVETEVGAFGDLVQAETCVFGNFVQPRVDVVESEVHVLKAQVHAFFELVEVAFGGDVGPSHGWKQFHHGVGSSLVEYFFELLVKMVPFVLGHRHGICLRIAGWVDSPYERAVTVKPS